jgi:CRP-like cAMP-binding protein
VQSGAPQRKPDRNNAPCRLAAIDTGNQLLTQLGADAWHHFEPDLELVELAQACTLQAAGAALQHVYFPTTAVVSLVSAMQDSGSTEEAVVGNEGMVGVCACMGGDTALSGGIVQTAGQAWRMRAPVLAGHATQHATVILPLLRYAPALFVQLAQSSARHRRHAFDQQRCCWLLLHQDHQPGNDLRVTQERIAELLGVRRETVTAGALKLQKLGLISYTRGHIVILDRHGLEGQRCECHAVVKLAYDKLSDAAPPAPLAVGHWRNGRGCVVPNDELTRRRRATGWLPNDLRGVGKTEPAWWAAVT